MTQKDNKKIHTLSTDSIKKAGEQIFNNVFKDYMPNQKDNKESELEHLINQLVACAVCGGVDLSYRKKELKDFIATQLKKVITDTIKEIADQEVDCELKGYRLAINEIRKEVERIIIKPPYLEEDFEKIEENTPLSEAYLNNCRKTLENLQMSEYRGGNNQALEDIKTFLNKLDQNIDKFNKKD